VIRLASSVFCITDPAIGNSTTIWVGVIDLIPKLNRSL
jgi:hypothetical protein